MDGSPQVAIVEQCQQQPAAGAAGVAAASTGDRPAASESDGGRSNSVRPISYRAADRAQAFARRLAEEQQTACRERLVYLNTLAVTTVGYHLSRHGFAIDYQLCDSCGTDSYSRKLFNVADLMLPGIGTLECRPILPDQLLAVLPPQESFDRLAVVLVEIDEADERVRILGFALPGQKHQQLPLLVPRHILYSPRCLGTFLKQREAQIAAEND